MEQMFTIGDGYFTTLSFDDDGRAYVGTGSEGRVWRVSPNRTASPGHRRAGTAVADAAARRQGFLVGTGDVGGVYRAAPAAPHRRPTCRAFWTASTGRAGGCSAGTGRAALASRRRSGIPPTGRDLVGLRAAREAAARRRKGAWAGREPARALRPVPRRPSSAADGRLAAVTLAYLPQNQRARVTGDQRRRRRAGRQRGIGAMAALAASGRRRRLRPRAHSTVIKLRWKVENPDGDELDYRLAFRGENDAVWRPLGGPDPLTKTDYDWNTEGLPDGTYVVKRHGQRRARRAARPRARPTSRYRHRPGRQPQARGSRPRREYPFVSGRARRRPEPARRAGIFDRRRRLADPVARRRHLRRSRRVVHD